MSPVHVIVSESVVDEQQWLGAFSGAIDLYRFSSNVEAWERLTSVQAPVDVLVVTANQDPLFNLTAAQLVQRLLDGPLGTMRNLERLQVVVVGGDAPRHPRVHAVSTLDAGIRLVQFGEVESAPQPVAQMAAPAVAAVAPVVTALGAPAPLPDTAPAVPQSSFLDGLIQSIWTPPPAPAPMDSRGAHVGAPVQPQQVPQQVHYTGARVQVPRGTAKVRGGGPATPLFARPQQATPVEPERHQSPGLQANVPYELPGRGVYRGLDQQPPTHIHAQQPTPPGGGSQPMPPAAAAPVGAPTMAPRFESQLQQLVYSPQQGANDPLLGWSGPVQQQLVMQQQPMPGPASHGMAMAGMAGGGGAMPGPSGPEVAQMAGVPQHVAHRFEPAPARTKKRRFVKGLGRLGSRATQAERPTLAPNLPPGGLPAGYGQLQPVGAPQQLQHQPPMYPQQMHAAHQQAYQPQGYPQQQPYPAHQQQQHQQAQPQMVATGGAFEASGALLSRTDSAGDVQFG